MQLRQLLSQVSVKNLHELGIDGTFAKFILFLPGFLAAGISSRVRRVRTMRLLQRIIINSVIP